MVEASHCPRPTGAWGTLVRPGRFSEVSVSSPFDGRIACHPVPTGHPHADRRNRGRCER